MNNKITNVFARYVLDSRATHTVEVDITLDNGSWGRAAVPSGASTGTLEAHELRDNSKEFNGKGVTKAVENVNKVISEALIGQDAADQENIDSTLIQLDETPNKSGLGANSILAVSMANLVAHSKSVQKYVYELIPNIYGDPSLPVPFMNILNGGAHADTNVDVQEFMVIPHGFESFPEALQAGVETYHSLKKLLQDEQLLGGVGDEGGFAPSLPRNEEGLRLVLEAIKGAGYSPGEQISIALDVAAQEFFDGEKYQLDGMALSGSELGRLYSTWIDNYPIVSIEDPFGEDDWDSWIEFNSREGKRIQIVGDDLYVTNPQRLMRGISQSASNAILIKLNQIGTVSETLEVIRIARDAGFGTIISHRSGETSDDAISDIAVGTNSKQIKTGAPARSDRTSKYNQLIRISEFVEEFPKLF